MKATLRLAAVAAACLLTGCHNHYVIEMEPEGHELARRLSVWGEAPLTVGKVSAPAEELEHLVGHHHRLLTPPEAAVQRFAGLFVLATPQDVGGAGRYVHVTTLMGSAGLYAERFRGDPDPAGTIERRLRAADELVDLLIGWCGAEMRAEPDRDAVRAYLDGPIRKLVRNASVRLWFRSAGEPWPAFDLQALACELLQSAVEHGALGPQELLPAAPALVGLRHAERLEAVLPLIQRLLAGRMGVGVDEPLPGGLAFLGNARRARESLEAYLRTTEAYAARLRQWHRRQTSEPQLPKPEPLVVVAEPVWVAFAFRVPLLNPDDELEVMLALPEQPFLTNGTWHAWSRQVRWSAWIEGRSPPLRLGALRAESQAPGERADAESPGPAGYYRPPTVCCAAWSDPDLRFQRSRFGRVVLTGADLFDYCLWRASLSEADGRRWDRFLAALRPDQPLRERLRDFRFAEQDAPAEAQGGASARARAVIEKILKRLAGHD